MVAWVRPLVLVRNLAPVQGRLRWVLLGSGRRPLELAWFQAPVLGVTILPFVHAMPGFVPQVLVWNLAPARGEAPVFQFCAQGQGFAPWNSCGSRLLP
jgi:hypothetical protein